MNVKIYGAGSIGNHFSHAALRMGWNVDVYDIDKNALTRMKNEIYPSRYGNWNEKIGLFSNSEINKKEYDLVIIGTPPDTHLDLYSKIIKESPKGILIEKPLCKPTTDDIKKISKISSDKTRVFVGYNHSVSKGISKILSIVKAREIGEIITIDVEFRENWKGIFDAHPWLKGPEDTYLGFSERGGGASGEHSHAINLWQHLSNECDFGKVIDIKSLMYKKSNKKVNYDEICMVNFKTESNKIGRVVQDVVTLPVKKYALIEGTLGKIEWYCHYKNHNDLIKVTKHKESLVNEIEIKKSRSDDFLEELKHVENSIEKNLTSPIDLKYGLETMKILQKIHNNFHLNV